MNNYNTLQQEVNNEQLWDNPDNATKIVKEFNKLKSEKDNFDKLFADFSNVTEIYNLAKLENEQDLLVECYKQIFNLSQLYKQSETILLLNQDNDNSSCFLEIHAGAGGTEAHDWASMLLDMYIRWSERHNFKVEEVDVSFGEEVGIKSVVIKINGEYAYGLLKTEIGVHRLVRISPFDSNKKRHTSFAAVAVYPEIDNDLDIDIQEKDLKIDTYRAGGAGGQHVNKTDSAVRITHLPTGIIVQSQNDRSQHRNKATALKLLQAKLFELEMAKNNKNKQDNYEQQSSIGWGYKIRSYVLQPYQLVKDLRTGVEKTNPKEVFAGDLDDFIKAVLILNLG
ncbi:peptide chain release factor 2 [Rickettsiales bacterium LUAb2]